MCGIAGYFGPHPFEPERLLETMVQALVHRGPDAQAVLAADEAGLGHARLSIIDLAGGAQPMSSADGQVHIAFNGEIFNYVELRDALESRGRLFRTRSDTEVILQLYDEHGPDCVHHLNGDFAFAIYDGRLRRLMLARDRIGVRPLVYTESGGCLYFGSEVKALLAVPGIEARLDPIALDQIFTLWAPIAPRTAFEDICELPPGHVLLADASGRRLQRYWALTYPDSEGDYDARSEPALVEELRALLDDATRIRLRSDVPVGAYLSGGLDSSLVSALAARIAPDRLRTFSVTFEDAEFDESAFQQSMVEALGTEHEAVACPAAEIGRVFPDVIRQAERPILRTAPAPLYVLSRLVRDRGFKVVLTGEGADEVFAGYDIFKEAKIRRFCAADPNSGRRALLLRRLYPYLPGLQGQSQKYLEAFFRTGAGEIGDPLFSHLPRFRSTAGAKAFFSGDLRRTIGGYDALEDLRHTLPDRFARWHPLAQAQYLETVHLLPGYILSSQGDRMAMAHGVEGRFPFLDHRVVEFAARIPPRLKLRTLREKHLLRESAKGLLPPRINERVKQPYRAPDSQSLVGPSAPGWVAEELAPERLAGGGWFEPRAVDRLAAKCAGSRFVGFRDSAALVGVLSTQLLDRQFVARRGGVRILQKAS